MKGIKETQIGGLALFRGCTKDQIAWVTRNADMLDLPAGRTIACEGDRVREFVVVVSGAAAATGGAGEVVLGPGAFYGELGLMDGQPHKHTVETVTPVRLLVFEARVFRGLLDRAPSAGRALLKDVVVRLREADQMSASRSLAAVS